MSVSMEELESLAAKALADISESSRTSKAVLAAALAHCDTIVANLEDRARRGALPAWETEYLRKLKAAMLYFREPGNLGLTPMFVGQMLIDCTPPF